MKILAIDTATERCSVALDSDGTILERQLDAPTGHAEHVLRMIDELLAQSGLALADLDAMAFGRGPGSFTGVRLAASVVQGLAFGAGRPVVPVSNLLAIGQQALGADPSLNRVLVCHDARMGEVYWCACERDGNGLVRGVTDERVSAPGEVAPPAAWRGETFAAVGTAIPLHPVLRSLGPCTAAEGAEPVAAESGRPAVALLPRAREILMLARVEVAAGRVLPAHEALPVYLRDQVAQGPRSSKAVS